MKRIGLKDFNLETSAFLEKTAGSSDGKGVKSLIPSENKIVLENGREIEYDYLVLANGLSQDMSIEGLEECLKDKKVPVMTNEDFC